MKQPKTRDPLKPEEAAAIRTFVARFVGNLPPAARHGHYDAKKGDGLADDEIEAPDGLYRVTGSDWLVEIKKGRFVAAALAKPPEYGGPGVVDVPSHV